METKRKKLSTDDVHCLETGDVVKSFKIRGMKKFEQEFKSHSFSQKDTPVVNVEGFVVERGFVSGDDWCLRLQKDKLDVIFKFPLETKVKYYKA